jgi:hypothetical protein
MNKDDALDGAPIAQRALANLQRTMPTSGRTGSDAREQISQTIATAYELLRADQLGAEMAVCFDLARKAGTDFFKLEQVRVLATLEKAATLGGLLTRDTVIVFCLATEGRIIADMTFVSRQDVENVKATINAPFNEAEETAADIMDQQTYRNLIELHAAIINFLVETARPLPSMLNYQFALVLPSLVISHRLYDTATKADEVLAENKIVHPAFCPRFGAALSNQ